MGEEGRVKENARGEECERGREVGGGDGEMERGRQRLGEDLRCKRAGVTFFGLVLLWMKNSE